MKIRLLGAHKLETKETMYVCLLIDDILAIDAGALTSRLSLKAQQKIQALLLSHWHYDHVKDLPAIGMNFSLGEKSLDLRSNPFMKPFQSIYWMVCFILISGRHRWKNRH
jgi:ribonuclease BN (tRNA processing enzyme)